MDTEPLCRDRRKTKGQRRQVFAAGVVVCACLVTRGPRASAAVRRAWSRGRVMPIAAAGLALWPFFFLRNLALALWASYSNKKGLAHND
jgi:hypothetical protein